MKIAFNPSTVAALTSPPDNKDITFDLRGRNIFARGVKFYGTDTNTWRDIKINNVSIGSHTLDLRNGSNTTLTNTNGVVTINSTWRPVVDNLTSNSATSSLSANQGRVLAGLINGKSDSDHNHDGRYVKKSGDTMLGALNFANGTWNLVGDDSYIGDCNVGGHFGIRAANTTYPGIAFFNKTGNHLGNLTAYSGNIKYGAYSLQFLDNGNTSVSVSTWTNPFSAYNSNAVADGQAICVWGQASQLSNLSTDTGDMSLWLKRVNAKVATLNIVLDGEYYANGNQRLAHISEIPTSLKNPHALTISLNGTSQGPYDGSAAKNINITPGSIGAATSGHNHDGRYLALSGGTMTGTINRHSGGATISGRDHAIIRQTYAPGGSSWNPIACVDTETGTWTLGHLSSGDSDTNFHFCFSTNTDYNAGNNAGNYVTLRNKVGTIALLSEIPDKNSWNYDDRYVRYYAVTTLDCNNLAVGLTAAKVTATNAAHTNHSAYLYISDVGTPFQIQIPDSSVPYIYKRYYGSDGWSGWFKLNAGYADSATKLQTARRIWGQSFNGTADVNGLLTHIISSDDQFLNVHDNRTSSGYQAIRYFRNGADVAALHWFHDKFGGYNWNSNCLNLDPYRGGYVTLGRWDNPDLTVVRGGNIGIGTTSPPYKLTVDGVGGDCVPIQLVNASRDGNWVCNAAFFAPNLTNNHNNTITIGKNYNSRNAFGLTHIHIGDGSSSNYAALEVWGVGNVQRWYYDRHSAFLHRADFSSLGSDASYMNSALQIREHSYGGTQADTWANAPRMSWHWSGRVQTQIGLGSNNELYLSKNNFGNAYRLMYETGTWGINISGNAASATNADTVDGYHILPDSKQVYIYDYSVASPDGAWILIKFPAWNANNEIVAIDGWGDNRQAHCVVHCGSRYQGIWGYQSEYNGIAVKKIGWRLTSDVGKFAIVALIDAGITSLHVRATNTLEISKTTEDTTAFAINSNFFSSGGVFHGNVYSASKLTTARSIWGQSFDGTKDINGTIYINNGNSENGAIILNNNVNTHARISAIGDQVVFNTGSALRFGGTEWEYSDWAGIKYDTVANAIYLGIADGTVFNYYTNKRSNGTLKFPGISNINLDDNAQIRREGSSQSWVNGRNGALLRETSVAGYHALWSLKTTNGSWDFGEYNAGSDWNNIPVLSYITDSNYNSGNNAPTYQIKFPLASGTVALTSNILNPTNYYWANVKISTSSSTTTSPTVHTLTATRICAGHDPGIDNSISCSNWFRSSGNTGWYNTTYEGGWYMSDTSWIRTHNSVGIYTSKIYADSSIRMSSIRLEKTNEINSSDNLLINYGSSTNVSLCNGGGNVGIGTMSPTQRLDVNGNIITKGFGIQPCYLSELNLLPTISPGDGYKYKCLEIGRTTEISCIIADKAGLMDERGILIKFNKGYDGQIILLKDLQNYGSGNGYFWVMPSGCNIIKADSSSILVGQNQISNTYDDGHSRFLVYSSLHNVWIEFLCANIN